ncbi:MAG: hypothetical protein JW862_02560 [Anaerolineales bacterium]|nr:hypothetical protein [Anaerolineales bacterium]
MDKKTIGIIALVLTIVCCALPGLVGLCSGSIFVVAGVVPGSEIDIFGSNDPNLAIMVGIATLCLSLIGIVLPVVVGFTTLREKKPVPVDLNEPLPEDL